MAAAFLLLCVHPYLPLSFCKKTPAPSDTVLLPCGAGPANVLGLAG